MSNPINEAAERAAFEAAAYKLHTDMYFNLRQDGEYKHGLARDLWTMWQAARASLPPASGEAGGLAAFERLMVDARENMMADPNEIAEILKLGPSYFTQPPAPEMQASHGAAGVEPTLDTPSSHAPRFDQSEFDAMVEKGTAAWKDVPDDWLEKLRGGADSAAGFDCGCQVVGGELVLCKACQDGFNASAADVRDAARYRWLRDPSNTEGPHVKHSERPIDMLVRQLAANRSAARYRNKETGLRHFCHEPIFRPYFINDIILLRHALRSDRKVY
jgi:hypothetical protein